MKIAAPAYCKDGVFNVMPASERASPYTVLFADTYLSLLNPLGIGTSLPSSPSK